MGRGCSIGRVWSRAKLAKRFEAETEKIAISEIVLVNLRIGAEKHHHRTVEINKSIIDFVLQLDVIPWAASSAYGDLRAQLARNGTPIGKPMLSISSISLNKKLITGKVKENASPPYPPWVTVLALVILGSAFSILMVLFNLYLCKVLVMAIGVLNRLRIPVIVNVYSGQKSGVMMYRQV